MLRASISISWAPPKADVLETDPPKADVLETDILNTDQASKSFEC